jgi:diguanylate cyclase (GGDEF)-like protein/PAS domain S-box-containing protein
LNFNVWLTPIAVSIMIPVLVSILRRRSSSSAIRGAARHCHVYDQAQCGLLSSGLDGKLLDCNEAFAKMTGHESREEMIGRPVIDFYDDPADRQKAVEDLLRSGVVENVRLKLKRKTGQTLDVLLNAKLSRNDRGEHFEVQGTVLDFTEYCRLERELTWQAQHDPLTALPNRSTVDDRLRQAVSRVDRYGGRFALLCIDVDRFKSINDHYGHQTGDEFLRQLVSRLSPRVRAADTFGRVGGDEFVIILDNFKTDEDVARVAKDLIHSLNTPLQISGQQLPASISIGIAKYPKDATNLADLRRRADHALYRAKELGRNQYQCYSRDRSAIDEGIELLNHLENGLKENLFELHYQPLVCSERKLRGVEALLRFNHLAKGLLLPKDFITVAEKSGLLHRIGEWAIREACRQLHEWRAKGLPEITLAVNVSAAQLASADFPAAVDLILREQGISPEMLELEITESLLMSEFEDALVQVDRLKQIGVRIAIDDFGIGYSSLGYLHQLPIDVLKIDRQFVKEVATPQGTLPIVEAIISLANALEIETVAEGIETETQLTILTRLGPTRFQGYLFSKPMPAECMTQCLQQAGSEE